MANDPWKHIGEAAAVVVTAAVGAVGSLIYQRKKKPSTAPSEEEDSALLRVEGQLDRISRAFESQGGEFHGLNQDVIRLRSEIAWVKASIRELTDRVSDLESRSTHTK